MIIALVGLWAPAARAADAAPEISRITVETRERRATITWEVSPESTGHIEYGTTPEYGSRTRGETDRLPFHRQRIDGLRPGTTYHFRIVSTSRAGATAFSPDMTFTTESGPPQQDAPTGVYGSAMTIDDKDNMQLSGRRLSHRFRASTSSELLSVRVSQRGGPVYSDGSGGRVRVSLQTDDGTRRHHPSGEELASLEVTPGNPGGHWTTYDAWTFPEPAEVTAGELYHIVFENPDPEPERDYISINEVFTWQAFEPRQPAFDDEDYAILYDRGEGWLEEDRVTAPMDVAYADGSHDGQGYIHNMCDRYGVISGPDQMVRERLTVSGGDRTVASLSVRLKRTSGTDPLVVHLEDAEGTTLASHDVPAESVPRADPGCVDGGGSVWVTVTFDDPVVLEDGKAYAIRLETGPGSQYTAEPIREGTREGFRSYRFTDGEAERTTTGGDEWSALYRFAPVDLQFYFTPAE